MKYRTAPLELRVVGQKWKYLVRKEITIQTAILGLEAETDYYHLGGQGIGKLTAKIGYAYNGPNWIRDSKDLYHASLWHDLIYQMIKHGHIHKVWRKYADKLFRDIYIEEATRIKLTETKKYWTNKDKGFVALEDRRLTWWDRKAIQNYAKLIYFGVRVGGGFSINKSEYAEEKFITI